MVKRNKKDRLRAKEQRRLEKTSGRRYGGQHAENSPMGIALIGGTVLIVGVGGYFAAKYVLDALNKRKK